MKLALIPPRGWERWALQSDFHLALAQVYNSYYDDVYQEAAKRDDFIIVDNGAAEGEPVGDFKLFSTARRWRTSEVVLPDVMFKGTKTVERAWQFEKNLNGSAYLLSEFQYMAVSQGETEQEVKRCIEGLSEIPFVQTIGIPRHLITTLRSRFIRLALAEWVRREFKDRFRIHFLGTNPSVPSEIMRAAREVPFVRSVDTSMPFNYAIAGVPLSLNAPALGRPKGYLTEHQNMSTVLLRNNIRTMKRWSTGNE